MQAKSLAQLVAMVLVHEGSIKHRHKKEEQDENNFEAADDDNSQQASI